MKTVWRALGVLCLVLLVAAIVYPMFAKARSHGGPSLTDEHLGQLYTALGKYADAHDGKLPPMQNAAVAQKALAPYAQANEWGTHRPANNFIDPRTNQVFLPNPFLSGKKMSSFEEVKNWLIAYYELIPAPHYGCMVLTLSGNRKYVSQEQWPSVKKASKIP